MQQGPCTPQYPASQPGATKRGRFSEHTYSVETDAFAPVVDFTSAASADADPALAGEEDDDEDEGEENGAGKSVAVQLGRATRAKLSGESSSTTHTCRNALAQVNRPGDAR